MISDNTKIEAAPFWKMGVSMIANGNLATEERMLEVLAQRDIRRAVGLMAFDMESDQDAIDEAWAALVGKVAFDYDFKLDSSDSLLQICKRMVIDETIDGQA